VVYSTEERARGSGRPGEVRAVGGWFNDYLRGYAGLSVVFSYLLFVFRYVATFEMELVFVLFWVGLPFFITVSTIPTFIYLDKVRERTAAYVRGFVEKMGIGSEISDS
jgi:nitrate/nitrite transporter NarK